MAKFCPDAVLDMSLQYIAGSATRLYVCSGSPLTYTDVTSTSALAGINTTSGCYTIADDTSGRKVTVAAKTSASITVSGSALAVALVNMSGSAVVYITTCTEQYLVSGGTVDIPSWKVNLQDPT